MRSASKQLMPYPTAGVSLFHMILLRTMLHTPVVVRPTKYVDEWTNGQSPSERQIEGVGKSTTQGGQICVESLHDRRIGWSRGRPIMSLLIFCNTTEFRQLSDYYQMLISRAVVPCTRARTSRLMPLRSIEIGTMCERHVELAI
jgi:hypothetical protein